MAIGRITGLPHESEAERNKRSALKESALAKLTDDEKTAVGLATSHLHSLRMVDDMLGVVGEAYPTRSSIVTFSAWAIFLSVSTVPSRFPVSI